MHHTHITTAYDRAIIIHIATNTTHRVANDRRIAVLIHTHINTRKVTHNNLNIALMTHIHRRHIKAAETQPARATAKQHNTAVTHGRVLGNIVAEVIVNKHTMTMKHILAKVTLDILDARPVMQDAEVDACLELVYQLVITLPVKPLAAPLLAQPKTHGLFPQIFALSHITKA